VTLQACTILSDTKCGARKDLEHMLDSDDEADYWEGAGGELKEFSGENNAITAEKEEQEEVWGRQRLREGSSSSGVEGARLLLREGLVERDSEVHHSQSTGPESQFGRPSFYREQEEDREVRRQRGGARPILDIMRQFLRKNVTERPWRSGKRVSRGRVRSSRRSTTSTTTTTTTTTTATTPETTTEDPWEWRSAQSSNTRDRKYDIEGEQLYDDDDYDAELRKYQKIETENDYGIEHDVVDELESTTESRGDLAIRELFHMIESSRDNIETAVEQVPGNVTMLQQLLIAASSVLLILIVALVGITVKRRRAEEEVERKLSGEVGGKTTTTTTTMTKKPPPHLPSSSSLHTVPSAVARSLRNIRKEGAGGHQVESNPTVVQPSENFISSPVPRAVAVDLRGITRLA